VNSHLKSHSLVPYGGKFAWFDPISRVTVSAHNFSRLLDKVRDERLANSLPFTTALSQQIENDLCSAYPSECHSINPSIPPRARLRFADVVAGTKAMGNHLLNHKQLVPPTTALARATECSTCPYNIPFSKPCALCPDLRNVVKTLTGSLSTPIDPKLHSCSICGCFLQSAVWLPLQVQRSVLSSQQIDHFSIVGCWKSKTADPT
jgi:hypothetical protein